MTLFPYTTLFRSYSGATRDLLEIAHLARARGAELILITRFPKSPGASLASVVLQCGTNESPLQMGSVAARVAIIFVLDVLFSEVCRRANPRTHVVEEAAEIDPAWFEGAATVGICGATSTPKWLMQDVADAISNLNSEFRIQNS